MIIKQTVRELSTKLEVIEAEQKYDSVWSEFVEEHKESTVYHTLEWLDVLEKETGQKVLKLICMDEDNNVVGLFPLQYTRGFPFGYGGIPASKRLSSLPRTPVCGPLALDDKSKALLIEKAINIVSSKSGFLLQIKSFNPAMDDCVNALKKYFWREIYVKEIPDLPEELRFGKSKNHAKIKWAVNKAEQNNVKFRIAESEKDIRKWYPLYLDTMRFHTTPARSYNFFYNLWEKLYPKGLMQLWLAEVPGNNENTVIAGSLLFYFNDTVTHAFSGSSRIRKHIELRPNDFLHWHAMLDAQKKGYRYYDFGEVSKDNLGLAAYKKKWDPAILKMYHYYYPEPEGLNDDDLDTGITGGVKEKIWQTLPLGLTAALSKIIYKKL